MRSFHWLLIVFLTTSTSHTDDNPPLRRPKAINVWGVREACANQPSRQSDCDDGELIRRAANVGYDRPPWCMVQRPGDDLSYPGGDLFLCRPALVPTKQPPKAVGAKTRTIWIWILSLKHNRGNFIDAVYHIWQWSWLCGFTFFHYTVTLSYTVPSSLQRTMFRLVRKV